MEDSRANVVCRSCASVYHARSPVGCRACRCGCHSGYRRGGRVGRRPADDDDRSGCLDPMMRNESRDRVRTAIRNSGFPFPGSRVTVSLAPADLKKVGAAFDLPIAIGILAASGALPVRQLPPHTVVGGLSLDGGIPAMQGLLPIAVAARRVDVPASLVFPSAEPDRGGIVRGLRLHPRAIAVGGDTCALGLEPDAGRAAPCPAIVGAAGRRSGRRARPAPRTARPRDRGVGRASSAAQRSARRRARRCSRGGCRACFRRWPSTRR